MNIHMTFRIDDEQRKAIGLAMGHRSGNHAVTRAEFTQWMTGIFRDNIDPLVGRLRLMKENPDQRQLKFPGMEQKA